MLTNAQGKVIAEWLKLQFPWLVENDGDGKDCGPDDLKGQLQHKYDWVYGLTTKVQPQMRMTPAEYVEAAHQTEAPALPAVMRLLGLNPDNTPRSLLASIETYADLTNLRVLHAAMGMCTEAGEFVDQMKKHIFYGKPLDHVNLAEEAGDLLWYVAIMCHATGANLTTIMENNIIKLRKRYPDKFKEYDALNRDTANELSHYDAATTPSPDRATCHHSSGWHMGLRCEKCGDVD